MLFLDFRRNLLVAVLLSLGVTFNLSFAAAIPRLTCPVDSWTVGGFYFGDDWDISTPKDKTAGRCPPYLDKAKTKLGPFKRHTGVDLRGTANKTIVKAAATGRVILVDSAGSGWGKLILIEHSNPSGVFLTQYMHVTPDGPSKKFPKGIVKDVIVKAGDPIAKAASITNGGSHLHFGIWSDYYIVLKNGDSLARRGALPKCSNPKVSDCKCDDGKGHNDSTWPQSFLNPLSYK